MTGIALDVQRANVLPRLEVPDTNRVVGCSLIVNSTARTEGLEPVGGKSNVADLVLMSAEFQLTAVR